MPEGYREVYDEDGNLVAHVDDDGKVVAVVTQDGKSEYRLGDYVPCLKEEAS